MSESLKVLAQLVPASTTLSDLYIVPVATSTSASSIVICNQNGSAITLFRVSIAIGGTSDDPKQYIYYDLALGNNDTFIATIGLSLGAGDVVRIQSSIDNVSFNLFGVEVTT